MLTARSLSPLSGIRHAFFTRQGGVSEGIYDSLNCGLGSDDERPRVLENRARVSARMSAGPEQLFTPYQTHSNKVALVEDPWAEDERPEADALVTRRKGPVLAITTADCVPVLFADQETGVVGAAHAGWRGALDGVLAATVDVMEQQGAERNRIVAAIGPAIEQRSYEVGPEFPAPFLEQSADNRDFFEPAERDSHFMFDIKGYVGSRLAALELCSVEILPQDTCGEPDLFFSYRRSCHRREADYGRSLSAIHLEP